MPRTKPKRQQKENTTPPPELSVFSLVAAISEASATTEESTVSSSQRRQSLQRKTNSTTSVATTASFATAREHPAESVTPGDTSDFVDSSDDDTTEGLNFSNDPLALISRAASLDTTPTEISFNTNPEETTTTMSTVVETPTPAVAEDPPVEAEKSEEEAHFDIAQNVYGTIKGVWSWGKTVPVVNTFLGLTEAVASKFVETTISLDLPTIEQQGVTPQLKKLDGGVIDPVILAVWKIVEPALAKGDEMVVKPMLTEVVPWVLAPLGMFEKKEEEKEVDEKEAMIDSSPTPEVVPAVN